MSQFNAGGFSFSGVGVATVAKKVNKAILPVLLCDASGSISGNEAHVRRILTGSVAEMKAKGVHEGAFLAAWDFSSYFTDALETVVPFTGIDDIDINTIAALSASGGTPMFEAAYNGLTAGITYATKLDEEGVVTDVFAVLVTDGRPEGQQKKTASDVKALLADARARKAEFGPATIYFAVVGIGDKSEIDFQKNFATEIGADAYFHAGDLKDGSIGKIIGWFSSSVHLSQQTGGSKAVDPDNFTTD